MKFNVQFKKGNDGTGHTNIFFQIIHVWNFFDQFVKNNIMKNENIRKIDVCQGYDDISGCLIGYPHFRENYKLIVTYLSKQ